MPLQMAGSIFLTGASGFLGGRLLASLEAGASQRVVCLRRKTPTPVGGYAANVEFVRGDLVDREAYAAALAGCGTVVHLAAATGKQSPAGYWRVNRDGTEALVLEARRAGVRRFLHVSTIAVKFADQSRYYYAQSKQQAEAIVAHSGMRFAIVRPTLILGRGSQVLEGLSRLAALPVVPVFGDGITPVQPIFVEDLASCVKAMLDEDLFDGQTVEIGGPEVLTIEDLLRRVRKARGAGEAHVMHLPARPIAAVLAWIEPLLGPVLPFTAGQLASFTNAGTVDFNPWVAHWQTKMKGVDEALQLSSL
jgi:nucleoside-diphosphate-sugar epimerase